MLACGSEFRFNLRRISLIWDLTSARDDSLCSSSTDAHNIRPGRIHRYTTNVSFLWIFLFGFVIIIIGERYTVADPGYLC